MKDNNVSSSAKTVKWVGVLLGVAFLIAGAMSLFLRSEDQASKEAVLRFAELGLIGLSMAVLSVSMEAVLQSLSRIEEKTSDESEDEDGDILA